MSAAMCFFSAPLARLETRPTAIFSEGFELVDFLAKKSSSSSEKRPLGPSSIAPRRSLAALPRARRPRIDVPTPSLRKLASRTARRRCRSRSPSPSAPPSAERKKRDRSRSAEASSRPSPSRTSTSFSPRRTMLFRARGGHHDTRAFGPRRRLPSRSPLDRARIRGMPTQHARRGCVTAVLKPPAKADPPRSASTETRQALDRRPGDPRREARRCCRCVTGQPAPHPAKRRDRLVPWSRREDKNRRR